MRNLLGALLFGVVLSVAAAAAPTSHAHAQMCGAMGAPTCVTPDVKGTLGVGLLGAELGFAVPAAIGIKDVWPYIVFPILGAAGGAVLGYFAVEQGAKSPELAVSMLVAGMVLIIPTMVLVLARTAYSPDDDPHAHSTTTTAPPPAAEDYDTGHGGGTTAPAGGGTTGGTTAPHSSLPRDTMHLASAGAGLFRLDETGFYMGFPGIGIAPTFSLDEMRENGISMREQQTSIRISLLTGAF